MPKSFQSRCLVLLVEDEALVAMNLQDELKEAGYAVGGPFDTCAAALAWLETETPDLAVLDTVLKDGTCKALAAELARRGVGFVLWSGHLQDKQTLQEFRDAVWVKKPSTHMALLDALASLRIAPYRQQAQVGAMNILVVEDDPLIRDMAVTELEEAGYEVMEAASGGQALRLLQTSIAVDALLTDIRMPEADGWEVARAQRQRFPDLPVVYVTGYTEQMQPVPGGVVISKPYRMAQLVDLLNALGGEG